MSVVTVQLGQYGNQLGCHLFETLAAHLLRPHSAAEEEVFFRHADAGAPIARGVLVDMEPRVVGQARQHATRGGRWRYADDRHFTKQSGSGNNWAYGYRTHGPASQESVSDLIRREVESCDWFGGFLFLQSLAGGTGSGVGAFVTEMVRDEFPNALLMNQVVWPYRTGEVVVQNYNALLTLAHLCEHSDGVVVEANEVASAVCTRLLNVARPNFPDLNRVIASSLAAVLLPSRLSPSPAPCAPAPSARPGRPASASASRAALGRPTNVLLDPLRHLCSHPSYKLLTIKTTPQMPRASVPFTVFQWPALLKHALQMLVTDAKFDLNVPFGVHLPEPGRPPDHRIHRSLATMLFLRGKDVHTADASGFAHPALYPGWVPDPLAVARHPEPVHQYEMSATALTNSGTIAGPLEALLERGAAMRAARAYLHQYARHGCDAAFFDEAFARAEQILADYRAI
eukprot:tig00000880_g5201.t1